MISFKEEVLAKIFAFYVMVMVFLSRFYVVPAEYANILILVSGFIVYFLQKKSICFTEDVRGYIKAYLIFALMVIPSILVSDNPQIGVETFMRIWVWPYVPFLALITHVNRRNYLTNMLLVFFLFIGTECLYAMLQSFIFPRGWGFTSNSILAIADIMCMLLPIALVIIMDARFEKRVKNAAVFAVFSMLAGLLANKSRGAWLTELVVIPIAVFRYLKKSKKYLAIFMLVLFGYLVGMFTNHNYVQRVQSITNTTTDHSNADRIWAWKAAGLMVKDYPVTGVGLGQFRDKYKDYKYTQESQDLVHTHNNFIQILVESGVIGFTGFLYFVGYFLYVSWKNYCKNYNPYDLLLFTTFLGHICIFGQIDYTLWYGAETSPVFWFLIAVLMQLKRTDATISLLL